jgi:hypothetical protein
MDKRVCHQFTNSNFREHLYLTAQSLLNYFIRWYQPVDKLNQSLKSYCITQEGVRNDSDVY